jgi:hypothetical protein
VPASITAEYTGQESGPPGPTGVEFNEHSNISKGTTMKTTTIKANKGDKFYLMAAMWNTPKTETSVRLFQLELMTKRKKSWIWRNTILAPGRTEAGSPGYELKSPAYQLPDMKFERWGGWHPNICAAFRNLIRVAIETAAFAPGEWAVRLAGERARTAQEWIEQGMTILMEHVSAGDVEGLTGPGPFMVKIPLIAYTTKDGVWTRKSGVNVFHDGIKMDAADNLHRNCKCTSKGKRKWK